MPCKKAGWKEVRRAGGQEVKRITYRKKLAFLTSCLPALLPSAPCALVFYWGNLSDLLIHGKPLFLTCSFVSILLIVHFSLYLCQNFVLDLYICLIFCMFIFLSLYCEQRERKTEPKRERNIAYAYILRY